MWKEKVKKQDWIQQDRQNGNIMPTLLCSTKYNYCLIKIEHK